MEERKSIGECVIIAPHIDDEIIGNYEIITNPLFKPIIIYTENTTEERKKEALKLKENIENIKVQLFNSSIPTTFLDPKNILYFPDPIYEIHPAHRKWGAIGEGLLRKGLNVIFYSVNMNAPYIHEVSEFDQKRKMMFKIYKSQINLFKTDDKYFLFEGRCKWFM